MCNDNNKKAIDFWVGKWVGGGRAPGRCCKEDRKGRKECNSILIKMYFKQS